MNVLILGSGGREHTLAWKLNQSARVRSLFVMPGNAGTAHVATNVEGALDDWEGLLSTVREHSIDYVVVGPEMPLADGVVDKLTEEGISSFGPCAGAAAIEGSKVFAKQFMQRHAIPTSDFVVFDDFSAAKTYIDQDLPPYVIKAAGLAAGKGVFLPDSRLQAIHALEQIMVQRVFGASGEKVVIEQRLQGSEVSLLAFTDGEHILPMPPAKDHKRLRDGDQGPNTGGMGVFAPSPHLSPALTKTICETIIRSAVDGLRSEGRPFTGTIYAGLILTDDGPQVLEFNCRFGDPETQVILPLLESDLLEIMLACTHGKLAELAPRVRWKRGAAVCVVVASAGYPGSYPTGLPVTGVENLAENVFAFHAGTKVEDGRTVTAGGRVLGMTALAEDLAAARELAYSAVSNVHFDGLQYRADIAAAAASSAYAAAGVNIEAGSQVVDQIKPAIQRTFSEHVLSEVGSFGGLFSAAGFCELDDPVLVSSIDGVGTKVMLASQDDQLANLGHDIVNHCINDILVQGARPLFFLDYIASDQLIPDQVALVVDGIAEACHEAGCSLLGGETAEMPGVYLDGQFDLAGCIVGVVERSKILPRASIAPGDLLLGLQSSSLHTNGFSLVRRIFIEIPLDHVYPEIGKPLADVLLPPHRSYLSILMPLLEEPDSAIKALAHITGGGFIGNLPRVLPEGLGVRIDKRAWPVPPIYDLMQRLGHVAEDEMYRVFNMGIGMIAILAPKQLQNVQRMIPEPTWTIGEVVPREGVLLA